MTPDLDIYRSANLLVKQHGEDAPIEAAMRADAMLEAATWTATRCGSGYCGRWGSCKGRCRGVGRGCIKTRSPVTKPISPKHGDIVMTLNGGL